MLLRSTSPVDGSTLAEVNEWTGRALLGCFDEVRLALPAWQALPVERRCEQLLRVADLLRTDVGELARLITLEMGKLAREARAEIEECALICEHFAAHGAEYLADQRVPSGTVRQVPGGAVLQIIPRFAPFALAMRGAVPALVAGNAVLLKCASSVTQCSRALEAVFAEALDPPEVFRALLLGADRVPEVIDNPVVAGVSFTGSRAAGLKVAEFSGRMGKKVTLHLGGSDPFVILADADLDLAVPAALKSRFTNAGQRASAAKRFVVDNRVADEFIDRFRTLVESELIYGDPQNEESRFAPMASHALRDRIHRQVSRSRSLGASVVTGCMPGEGPGSFYQGSILDRVWAGMPAYEEELFGPVAAVLRVADEDDAIRVANDTVYGISASLWSADLERARQLAPRLVAGQVFINRPVEADPSLPYGGVAESGYGRLLGRAGTLEFAVTQAIVEP